jgi:heat shock protein HtpX
MNFIKRIALFLLANIAIMVIITTIFYVFGIGNYLTPYGLNIVSLLIYSVVVGFVGSFFSLLFSKPMAKWMMKVQIIATPHDPQEKRLIDVIAKIASRQNIKMPEVGIYPSPEVNAFATGYSQKNALVAVSAGLLENFSDDELEGVLAHEMAHITNGDMVTMTLLQGVINTFVIFAARTVAFFVGKFLSRNEDLSRLSYYLLTILFEIVFGILASVIVLGFSRYREFRADAGGAKFSSKEKMIACLKKLKTMQELIDTEKKSLATMKISDKKSKFGNIFSSHPSLDERIKALETLTR